MPSPTYMPGPSARTIRTAAGAVKTVPADWVLLPPGDAGLTRRVKAAGVRLSRNRRIFEPWVEFTPHSPV